MKTNQTGLYVLGDATVILRIFAVETTIEQYVRLFLIGKVTPTQRRHRQFAVVSGYWRSAPDHEQRAVGYRHGTVGHQEQGRRTAGLSIVAQGLPRRHALYRHSQCEGEDEITVEDNIRASMEEPYQHVRQIGHIRRLWHLRPATPHRQAGLGENIQPKISPCTNIYDIYFDPDAYLHAVPKRFDHLRNILGSVWGSSQHARKGFTDCSSAVAKNLEQYQIFLPRYPERPKKSRITQNGFVYAEVRVARSEGTC